MGGHCNDKQEILITEEQMIDSRNRELKLEIRRMNGGLEN